MSPEFINENKCPHGVCVTLNRNGVTYLDGPPYPKMSFISFFSEYDHELVV